MPKRLVARRRPDSIREFRLAARQRFDDGLALVAADRRAGAIYLWGYAAEMTLKAAYFALTGMADGDEIPLKGHLYPAIERGKALGVDWPGPGQGHNVRAWAELLVAARAQSADTIYEDVFGRAVQRYGQQVGQLWRETLRYGKNRAYAHEVGRVREAVEWLLTHSAEL